MLAEAASEGYEHHPHRAAGQPRPFHGYVYRLLTRQGAGAQGGAKDYIVEGKMTGGFALVAYPVRYQDSGVMTFLVNQDGQIYQKDLGPRTAQIASAMVEYNPDNTWQAVAETGDTNISELKARRSQWRRSARVRSRSLGWPASRSPSTIPG
jgi:hypothetical protein